ncbi:hypothetical protein TRVA0_027S00276 [Trichomonascus vanleenenianus]|uniref:uncharacterized protein n=1 Tax=Trichomonascus vanleenenianus TaxID=2268995 RepID=UPI003ECB25E0
MRSTFWPDEFDKLRQLRCLTKLTIFISNIPSKLRLPETLEQLSMFCVHGYSRDPITIEALNVRRLEVDRYDMLRDWAFVCERVTHLIVWDQHTESFPRPNGLNPFPMLKSLQLHLFLRVRMQQMIQFYKPPCVEVYGFPGHRPTEFFECQSAFEGWSDMRYIPPTMAILVDPLHPPSDLLKVIRSLLAKTEVHIHVVGCENLSDPLGLSRYAQYLHRVCDEALAISCYRIDPRFATARVLL